MIIHAYNAHGIGMHVYHCCMNSVVFCIALLTEASLPCLNVTASKTCLPLFACTPKLARFMKVHRPSSHLQ